MGINNTNYRSPPLSHGENWLNAPPRTNEKIDEALMRISLAANDPDTAWGPPLRRLREQWICFSFFFKGKMVIFNGFNGDFMVIKNGKL